LIPVNRTDIPTFGYLRNATKKCEKKMAQRELGGGGAA